MLKKILLHQEDVDKDEDNTGKDDLKSYLSFHLLKSTKYTIMHRNNSVHRIKDDVPDNADEVMCVDWSS